MATGARATSRSATAQGVAGGITAGGAAASTAPQTNVGGAGNGGGIKPMGATAGTGTGEGAARGGLIGAEAGGAAREAGAGTSTARGGGAAIGRARAAATGGAGTSAPAPVATGGGGGGGSPDVPTGIGGTGGGGGGGAGGGGGGGAGGDGAGGGGGGGGPAPPAPGIPVAPLTDVGIALTVCGATAAEIHALEVTERLNRLAAFSRMSPEDVNHLASRLEKRQPPGNLSLPFVLIKNVQALCFWAAKARRQHRTPLAADFTLDTMEEALNEMEIKEADSGTSPNIKPEVLKEENWEEWSQEFPMYLSHIMGRNAALDYIVGPEVEPGHVHATTRESELHDYPLSGPFFREDNKEVFRLLSNRVKDQPATWILPFQASQNGRAAWLALVNHYDGGGQKEKCINKAEKILSSAFYNNEPVYPFNAYAATIMCAFRTLKTTPNRCTAINQVKILINNICISTADFAVIKGHIQTNHRADLDGAIEYISRRVSELFPNITDSRRGSGRHRFISAADSSQPPSNRPRNFEALQQYNGIFTFYGVDVTNVFRRFSNQE